MPIGVASISFTWEIPAGSTERTWEGRGVFAIAASMPGTRLSRIRVVFPEPETPVTTVRRPLGIFTLSGFTVWMAPVEREMAPCSNKSFSWITGRRRLAYSGFRKAPMRDTLFSTISEIVPSAITCPPFAPASGPISMSQSAWDKICVSWSTKITEFPSAIRSSITPVSPTIFTGWSPMDGSSST